MLNHKPVDLSAIIARILCYFAASAEKKTAEKSSRSKWGKAGIYQEKQLVSVGSHSALTA
jgi:hypothetical protein